LAVAEELSLPDHNMTAPPALPPGQPFRKEWRVRNTGTCTWEEGYRIVYAGGTPAGAAMGSRPLDLHGTVAPGESYTVELPLVAPISPGVYAGTWQMEDAYGRTFGEPLRVGIEVASVPTATPAPTQTPSPGIAFAASSARVQQGSPVTLTWDVQGATEVYFYQAGEEWQGRAVGAQGSREDAPGATTTYNLRVVRNGGEEVRALTVYVDPTSAQQVLAAEKAAGDAAGNAPGDAPGGAPTIDLFAVLPPAVTLGECVELRWVVGGAVGGAGGGAGSIRIERDGVTIMEGAPARGGGTDCPRAPGLFRYRITAGGGEERGARAEAEVSASAPSQPAAAPVTESVPASQPPPTIAPPSAPAAAADTIVQKEYVLISYRNAAGALTPPLTGTRVTVLFGADGALRGNGGCNAYDSTFTRYATQLTIAPIAGAETFCAEPIGVMEQEVQYLSALQTAAAYTQEGGMLTLLDGAGNPVAVYVGAQ
jgi:hypothetical protein